MKVFDLDPAEHRDAFLERGYVYIRRGVSAEFLEWARTTVANARFEGPVTGAGIAGAKDQYVLDFPDDQHYAELYDTVADLCGLRRATTTLSERHVKAYELDADPSPSAHKDRFASQVSVGISLEVPTGSHLVLFPHTDRWVNPFLDTSLRHTLEPDRDPDRVLENAPEVVFHDEPGDVVVFLGSDIWHLRRHSAGTVNVYLKFNDFGSDPLGEDPATPVLRASTLALVRESNDELLRSTIPVLSRRFVSVLTERRREGWPEMQLARVWDQHPFPLSPPEVDLLQRADGRLAVGELLAGGQGAGLDAVRRLATRGALDLLSPGAG